MWTVPEVATAIVSGNVMDYGHPQLIARYAGMPNRWITNWSWATDPDLIWYVQLTGTGVYDSGSLGRKSGMSFPYGRAVVPP